LFPKGATACSVADRPVIPVFMGLSLSALNHYVLPSPRSRKPIVYYPLSSSVAALAAAKVIEWTLTAAGWNGTVVQSSAVAVLLQRRRLPLERRVLASSSSLRLITVISVVPLSHDIQSQIGLLF